MRIFISELNVQLEDKLNAIIRLTRWREHIPYTIPLTIIGAMLAVQLHNQIVDLRLIAVIVANILTMCFAFMINDVADAPDDALDPRKKAHNVISSGILTEREGIALTAFTAVIAFALYALAGRWALILGGVTLLLCYLYSAYPFRLKARPVTDVVSHALMLSGLLVMTGFFTYATQPGAAWFVIAAATLFSAYGQFYNQIDDYEVDKAAGLKNTVVLLGKTGTSILMFGALIGAAVCMGIALMLGLFPVWLGLVTLVGLASCLLFTWETDMRGNPTKGTGAAQKPTLLVANVASVLWLLWSLGWFLPAF